MSSGAGRHRKREKITFLQLADRVLGDGARFWRMLMLLLVLTLIVTKPTALSELATTLLEQFARGH